METWGPGPFENDDAAGWLNQLEEANDEKVLEEAFALVTDEADGYLEAPECAGAIVAAEMVAALLEKPHAALPDDAKAWAEGRPEPPDALVTWARRALHAVRGESELSEQWDETPDEEMWQTALEDLESRLTN